MKTERDPNLAIVPTEDLICSCNVCGESNCTGGFVSKAHEPLRWKLLEKRAEIEMFDLRISANGRQTHVTMICRECLSRLHELSRVILHGEAIITSWRKS